MDATEPHMGRSAQQRAWMVLRWSIAGLLAAACGAWLLGGSLWIADLVGQVTGVWGFGAFAFGGWWAIRKRWASAGVCGAALAVAVAGVVPGRTLWAGGDGQTDDGSVRVLVYNALAHNEDREGVRSTILDADADVVGLLEPPTWLVDELREGGAWRERYPHYFVSERASAGFKVVLSRWPQYDVESRREGAKHTLVAGTRQMLLDRPAGAFAFTLVHPRSPRTPARWRAGNALVETLVARHESLIEPLGVAHVVAGDFNATPMGYRSRALAAGGLLRAKPLGLSAGTFPGWAPWPLSLAIDDVLVSPLVVVERWRAADGGGSDHRAVIVDLTIPVPPDGFTLARPDP